MSHYSTTPSLLEVAQKKRDELSQNWPTAIDVSRALNDPTGRIATTLREEGKLLAVYIPSGKGHYRYPSWQFDSQGKPLPGFHDILEILRDSKVFGEQGGRSTGWYEVEWFQTPHTLLDGHTPIEKLVDHPEQVLDIAKTEFESRL